MPRLPNVTMDELETMIDSGSFGAADMRNAADRISKGYCDKPEKLMEKIVGLNNLIHGASELLGALVLKLRLVELQTETEVMLRARLNDQANSTA